MQDWLERADALRILGVKAQTLYAYVSRGLIESRRHPDLRRSLYRSEDVAALARKQGRSRKPASIAASSMSWGEPAVTTTICTVRHGRLIYRGYDAVTLSQHASLEATAQILWNSDEAGAFEVPARSQKTPFLALAALVEESKASTGRGNETCAVMRLLPFRTLRRPADYPGAPGRCTRDSPSCGALMRNRAT